MKTNVIMISRDRGRLADQALRSVTERTPEEQYTLVYVDDGSYAGPIPRATRLIGTKNYALLELNPGIGILGGLRNIAAWYSEKLFGRGDFLCFLDNDICIIKDDWLEQLAACVNEQGFQIVGGCRHPHHDIKAIVPQGLSSYRVEQVDAVAGYCMMMKWNTYDKYGPFKEDEAGVGRSEDTVISQKVVDEGGRVGYIQKPVLLHCGITNSEGKPALGWELFLREPGIIYE